MRFARVAAVGTIGGVALFASAAPAMACDFRMKTSKVGPSGSVPVSITDCRPGAAKITSDAGFSHAITWSPGRHHDVQGHLTVNRNVAAGVHQVTVWCGHEHKTFPVMVGKHPGPPKPPADHKRHHHPGPKPTGKPPVSHTPAPPSSHAPSPAPTNTVPAGAPQTGDGSSGGGNLGLMAAGAAVIALGAAGGAGLYLRRRRTAAGVDAEA